MEKDIGTIIISIIGILLILVATFFGIKAMAEEQNKYTHGFYQYMVYVNPDSKELYIYDHGSFEPLLDATGNQIIIQEEQK